MSWVKELEKAIKGRPADDEQDENTGGYGDGDEDEEDEEEKPVRKGEMCKSTKAGVKKVDKYEPDPNGETGGDEDDEPTVSNPRSIDKKTGGGSVRWASGKGTKKSLADNLSDDEVEAIDASPILASLCKSLDGFVNSVEKRFAIIEEAIAENGEGLAVIGKALGKSLEGTQTLLKSIKSDVEEIGSQPRQRKSTVRTVEKSFGAGNERSGELPGRTAILAKSVAAMKAGKCSSMDVARLEAAYNAGNTEMVRAIWTKINGE